MVPNVGTTWCRLNHTDEKIGTGGEKEGVVREELVT
jgi:hypothetical protein